MEKIDLKKTDSSYYKAGNEPQLHVFEAFNYLTIQGVCAPEDELFSKSMEALYSAAYTLKFSSKENGHDFVIPKLEGLWWVVSDKEFKTIPRSEWHWKLLIRMPDFVTDEMVQVAIGHAFEKKGLEHLKAVSFESMEEGDCVQILHTGSYEEEERSIKKLMDFATSKQMAFNGHHHEIYLSDPLKTPEERLKTIIRYPVK